MNNHTKNASKKPSKADQIKLTAQELFRSFGYNKVSIDEVCKLASASKMTFYRHFKNKPDLLRHIFSDMAVMAQQQAEEILSRDEHFSQRFNAILKLNENFRERLGYRLINDLVNLADTELKTMLEENASNMRDLNLRFIAEGKAAGFFRSDLSDEFMLFLAEKLNDILTDKRFATFYPDFSAGLNAVTHYFYFGVANQPLGRIAT